MRKASAFAALLFLLGVLALGQQPRAQLTATGVGGGGFGGASAPTCVSLGYVGPGDVAGAGSALAWWGLRAYTAATCGAKLLNVCNSTGGVDVGCGDLSSSTTTGALVSGTIGGITCPGVNCTVKTAYDLTGGGNCTGSCDASKALIASCAGLTSRPCMQPGTSGTPYLVTVGNMSLPQPWSMVATSKRTSVGPNGGIDMTVGFLGEVGYQFIANSVYSACDFSITTGGVGGIADGTWHNFASTCASGAGGTLNGYVNGSVAYTTTGAGTTTISGQPVILYVNGDGIQAFEFGIYGSAINAAVAALSANQRADLGF
jgi:hypothetical protein